jgi:hypothetical protein
LAIDLCPATGIEQISEHLLRNGCQSISISSGGELGNKCCHEFRILSAISLEFRDGPAEEKERIEHHD